MGWGIIFMRESRENLGVLDMPPISNIKLGNRWNNLGESRNGETRTGESLVLF